MAAPPKFQAVVAYRTIFVKISEFVRALPEQLFMDIDLYSIGRPNRQRLTNQELPTLQLMHGNRKQFPLRMPLTDFLLE